MVKRLLVLAAVVMLVGKAKRGGPPAFVKARASRPDGCMQRAPWARHSEGEVIHA